MPPPRSGVRLRSEHRHAHRTRGGSPMATLDTVIKNALVATAADVFAADVGIAGGVITALGRGLGPARREIDAAGRYVLPGGIDAHCHFDQPMRDSVKLGCGFR